MTQMTEQGFYHPTVGYWQTTGVPSQVILDSYPEGTVNVPLKPGPYFEWNGTAWIEGQPPEPSEAQVIDERDRRIDAGTLINVTGIGDIPVSGRPSVQVDLQGLATAAQIALAAGNTTATFPFRDEVKTIHSLTPDQVIELYMEGVQWISQVRAAAWALIDMAVTPQDFAADTYWP